MGALENGMSDQHQQFRSGMAEGNAGEGETKGRVMRGPRPCRSACRFAVKPEGADLTVVVTFFKSIYLENKLLRRRKNPSINRYPQNISNGKRFTYCAQM